MCTINICNQILLNALVWVSGCYACLPDLTWEVPAASSRAALHPAALVDGHCPVNSTVILQRVRGQVTDLDSGEVPLEVLIRHPGSKERCT